MRNVERLCWQKVSVIVVLALSQASPATLFAKSPVTLQNSSGTIDFSADGPFPFQLSGNASHLGKYTAYGEVDFVPGEAPDTFVGEGVVVFKAANGDLLVGIVEWVIDAAANGFRTCRIRFSWRDSIEFVDGPVVYSTGRFVDDRPPGVVLDAKVVETLIAIAVILFPPKR
jgi:hypothetical protein